ncbi:UDP-N-acetylmuramoylalanine--D-glutamate ligase [Clostridiales Family XIII bacterium PM5-7]
MKVNLDNFKNKRVLIVGLGKSGIAAAQAMVRLNAKVYIQDAKKEDDIDPQLATFLKGKGIICFFNCLPPDMSLFELLILSPGVSPELSFIQEAQEKGAEIIGELEVAFRIGRGNYVAITGTNGKTTTTTLVGEIFRSAARKTYVVGNIGVAVISASIDADEQDWLVTETSSFQLETTKYFKPSVSAILNLTPDHLNRHHTMDAYGQAKAKIFANQREDGYLVINYDDKPCYKLAKDCQAQVVPFSRKEELNFGAFLKDGQITIKNQEQNEISICGIDELKMIGVHNQENALAAAAIAYFSGIDAKVIGEVLRTFGGVEHRLEFCGELEGVKYYNDSKGTNIDATITALSAIEKNIILIAGGDGKGQDFDQLVEHFPGTVKELILLGRDGHLIQESAEKYGFTNYVLCKDMEDCVRKAYELAEAGDNVLLSPACASWDMYDNFEQRGEHFKNCVDRL